MKDMVIGCKNIKRKKKKHCKYRLGYYNNYDTYLIIKCPTCNKIFERRNYDVRRWNNYYCCNRCRKKDNKGPRNVWWEEAFIISSRELKI
jgi:hypothetical protein